MISLRRRRARFFFFFFFLGALASSWKALLLQLTLPWLISVMGATSEEDVISLEEAAKARVTGRSRSGMVLLFPETSFSITIY